MNRLFTETHEWIELDGEVATIGITDFAQAQLGDLVFVELPKPGATIAKGDEAAVVESVKAASEVYTPVGGTVVEVNGQLEEDPSLVNSGAESVGWFLRLKIADQAELDGLLDPAAYAELVASLD